MTTRFLAIALLLTSCMNDTTATTPAARSSATAVSSEQSAARDRITAAEVFTRRYDRSRMSAWKIRANAAGPDCSILTVHTTMVLDDSMVEAMHYGTGPYDVYDGGVQRFSATRGFRGVAYEDDSRRIWTYGGITVPQAELLTPCH